MGNVYTIGDLAKEWGASNPLGMHLLQLEKVEPAQTQAGDAKIQLTARILQSSDPSAVNKTVVWSYSLTRKGIPKLAADLIKLGVQATQQITDDPNDMAQRLTALQQVQIQVSCAENRKDPQYVDVNILGVAGQSPAQPQQAPPYQQPAPAPQGMPAPAPQQQYQPPPAPAPAPTQAAQAVPQYPGYTHVGFDAAGNPQYVPTANAPAPAPAGLQQTFNQV